MEFATSVDVGSTPASETLTRVAPGPRRGVQKGVGAAILERL